MLWRGHGTQDYYVDVDGGHKGTLIQMTLVSDVHFYGSRLKYKALTKGQNDYNVRKRRCRVRVKCEKKNSFRVRFRTKSFFNLRCNQSGRAEFPTFGEAALYARSVLFKGHSVKFTKA